MHQYAVDKYHDKHSAKDPRVIYDKVETRPKNDREACDIGNPTNLTDDGCQDWWAGMSEFFDKVAGRLENQSECGYDNRPEIDSRAAFECYIDEHKKLNAHPIGDRTE